MESKGLPNTSSPAAVIQPNTIATNTNSPQNSIPIQAISAAVVNPNVVTIPVPIVNQEDIYTYISVKGSLHDRTCNVFGLNEAEVLALSKRFDNSPSQIVNGIMVMAPPMQLINTLSQLGYKVVCSTGDAEIVWTMQREV